MRKQYFSDQDLLEQMYPLGRNSTSRFASDQDAKKPLISIVMAHRNRPDLLRFTLHSIERSAYRNVEVIIVDDRSDSDKKPDFLHGLPYSFPIILHSIDDQSTKGVRNPLSVYNLGFAKAKGDVVVIQNPECVHVGDLLSYIDNHFEHNDYISFPAYSSNNIAINDYILEHFNDITISTIAARLDEANDDDTYMNFPRWYQHPEISDRNLHFCTVISRDYLEFLGGFDTSYEGGLCYEDDDLILRIKDVLKLNIKSVHPDEGVGVIHMFHGRNSSVNIPNYNGEDPELLEVKRQFFLNKNLFDHTLKCHKEQKICIPKLCHFYWDNPGTLSLLHVVTLLSFVKSNFGWILVLWMPKFPVAEITWDAHCHKETVVNDETSQLFNYIKVNVPNLVIKEVAMQDIGFGDDCSEVHKADYLRYYALQRYGGVWSDLDIVYLRPLSEIFNFDFDNIIFKCTTRQSIYSKCDYHELEYCYFPVGMFLTKRGSRLFSYIMAKSLEYFDKTVYQSIGADLLLQLFASMTSADLERFGGENNVVLDNEYYLPFQWYDTGLLYDPDYVTNEQVNKEKAVGIHWFNGHALTTDYIRYLHSTTDLNDWKVKCYMDELIDEYLTKIRVDRSAGNLLPTDTITCTPVLK